MENTPSQAWFSPPEGVYTLIQSLNVTTSSTAHFVANPAAPAPPVAQPGATPNDPVVLPPPPHPTKMATAVVTFTVKEQQGVSGLGMSMGSLRATGSSGGERSGVGPIRRGSSTAESSPMLSGGVSSSGAEGIDPVASGSGARTNGGNTSTPSATGGMHGSFSPLLKRRPLTSSFSIPTLGSLGAGNGGSNGGSAGEAGVMTSRPIRQFRGTSSSFVRSWEGLPLSQAQLKGIAEGNSGRQTVFGFYTSGKSVVWVEVGQGRPKEALARVVFNVAPTCIDVNQHTMSSSQIDVLVGFSNGDVFWFDPLTSKYTRLNKSGIIASSPITSVAWLPPSPTHATNENHSNLFLTSHADGTMLVWDKDREDWSGFTPTSVPSGASLRTPSLGGASKENDWGSSTNGEGSYTGNDSKHAPMSSTSLPAGMSDLVVSRPANVDKKGGVTTKYNPVSHWRVSKKAITAFAFSPDLQLCAAVGEDGCLRIINAAEEKLLDTFAGYFGSLNCVAWSPDGRFVVTGGQDDLCTIYSPLEQRIVARCQGHSSWVTGIAWDPWRSDERTMRFASVGEDCKLILWDLSSAALTRPKAHAHIHHRRHSLSSQRESVSHLPLSSAERTEPIFHPSPRRDDVAMLQPIMVKTLSADLFSGLNILPNYLITLSRSGQIKMFDRPPEVEEGSGLLGLSHEFAGSVVALDRRAR